MSEWRHLPAGKIARQRKEIVRLEPGVEYRTMGVRWYGKGSYDRGLVTTATVKAKSLYRAREGDFTFNRIDTQKGAFDVVPAELDGALATNEFPLYEVNREEMDARFLLLNFQRPEVLGQIGAMRAGSEGRARWKEADFETWTVPLPPIPIQERIVEIIGAVDAQIAALAPETNTLEKVLDAWITTAFSTADRNVPLGEIAEVQLGKMLSKERAAGPDQAPYLRNADVQWQGLNLTDLKSMTFTEKDRQRYALRAGDILSCEGGDPGRSVLLSKDLDGIFYQKAVHRVRATAVDPRFLYVAIKHAYTSGTIADLCTVTTIKHLTAEKYRTLRVPLLSEEQQARAIEVHDVLFAQIAAIRAEADRLSGVRTGLLSSLLDRTIDIKSAEQEI
ncbi:restriction endonuclease subunit S [Rhodococcus zopfii]|uniref:restriction endonuclease subunit S n=1 Tax=Rhodococcus zopfii TaxID=43772 RepID=UPI003668EE9D